MKVGDLVKYRSGARWAAHPLGLVLEVARNNDRRVKWLSLSHPLWVRRENLEVVSESVRTKRRDAP